MCPEYSSSEKIFTREIHPDSPDALSLTVHVAHATTSNLLISLRCHTIHYWRHTKPVRRKLCFRGYQAYFPWFNAHGTDNHPRCSYSAAPTCFSIGKAAYLNPVFEIDNCQRNFFGFPALRPSARTSLHCESASRVSLIGQKRHWS